jgi:TPR repeat protein
MDVQADVTDDQTLQRNCGMFASMAAVLRDLINAVENEGNHDAISEHSKAVRLMQGSVDDQIRACELYWYSANKGYAGALNNLGDLYEQGLNLPQSEAVAAYWYGRAAERGEPTAYLSLATLLLDVGEDAWMHIEAAKFALLAVEHLVDGTNKTLAHDALYRLEILLTNDAMEVAKSMAGRWEPLFQEPYLMSDKPEVDAPSIRLLN